MSSKWIGGVHKGQVGTRWSPSGKTHTYNPEDRSSNAERQESDMRLHVEFSTEPTKGDWPSSVQGVRLLTVSTGAR